MNGLVYFPPYTAFAQSLGSDQKSGVAYKLTDYQTGQVGFTLVNYDLKNSFEALTSRHKSRYDLPDLSMFGLGEEVPYTLLKRSEWPETKIHLQPRTSRTKYLENVSALKRHISRGDIYEVNYCIEFFAEETTIDPVAVFDRFASISEAPFSFYLQLNEFHLLCASPERFMKKIGSKLISQPIKGTRRRSSDQDEDRRLIDELRKDEKERTENIMIVDLVRNDLSRIAKKASVHVDELCEIYSFRQVHQMISTISCEARTNDLLQILDATFPMGSMTGAPKICAMQLIDEYEDFNRGPYSGSAGIILPDSDFDLNVIIRSIYYDSKKKYLSFSVGSAITAGADPEKEYVECLLKAKAMFVALGCEDQWNTLSHE